MSRQFTGSGSSGQVLSLNTAVITGAPFSVSGWVRPAGDGSGECFDWDDGTAFGSHMRLRHGGIVANKFTLSGADDATANVTIAHNAGIWVHICAIVASTTDRRIYVNGDTANKGSGTASQSWTIARYRIGGPSFNVGFGEVTTNGWQGDMAVVGYWDAELSEAQVVELSKGKHPFMVKPASLVHYYDCGRHYVNTGSGEQDQMGAGDFVSNSGPGKAETWPPVYML